MSFSWDARSTVSIYILAFLFIAALRYGRRQSTRPEWEGKHGEEDTPILFFPLDNGGISGDEEEVTENKTGVVV
jgi:hypothetical protein